MFKWYHFLLIFSTVFFTFAFLVIFIYFIFMVEIPHHGEPLCISSKLRIQ